MDTKAQTSDPVPLPLRRDKNSSQDDTSVNPAFPSQRGDEVEMSPLPAREGLVDPRRSIPSRQTHSLTLASRRNRLRLNRSVRPILRRDRRFSEAMQ